MLQGYLLEKVNLDVYVFEYFEHRHVYLYCMYLSPMRFRTLREGIFSTTLGVSKCEAARFTMLCTLMCLTILSAFLPSASFESLVPRYNGSFM